MHAEGEVQKREVEFSTFRDVNVLICSWNIDAQKPEALTGSAENVNFLENVLHSVDAPDIIVFGFQELIDLENRSLTASKFVPRFHLLGAALMCRILQKRCYLELRRRRPMAQFQKRSPDPIACGMNV